MTTQTLEETIGRLLNLVYTPSAGMRDSIGSTISFFHASMVVHSEPGDHLQKRKFIHKGLSLMDFQINNGFVTLMATVGTYYSLLPLVVLLV